MIQAGWVNSDNLLPAVKLKFCVSPLPGVVHETEIKTFALISIVTIQSSWLADLQIKAFAGGDAESFLDRTSAANVRLN